MSRLVNIVLLVMLSACRETQHVPANIIDDQGAIFAKLRDYEEGFTLSDPSDDGSDSPFLLKSGVCQGVTIGAIDNRTIGVNYERLEITYMSGIATKNDAAISLCNNTRSNCPTLKRGIVVRGCP